MAAKVINTVLKLRDEMSGGLLKAAKNTEGVTDEMKKATRQVVAFKNKSVSAISATARQFADLGKKVTLATVAAGGAVATLAAKTGFSEAMDLEGYRLQLETATKDTQKASEIMRYAVEMANKTPFEGGEMVEAAAKFESMGMSATTWLARAGDMAAATNKSMDQATEALIDAQTGELDRLKEFGITKALILQKGEEMFHGVQIAANNGSIVNQEKFNEAMIALMEDRFAGGMEKQATTMKGLWSTVTGVTKSALANIVGMSNDGSIRAGSALEFMKERVKTVAETLTQWQQDGTIDAIADKLTNYLGKGLEFAGRATQTAGKAFSWLRENAIAPLQEKFAQWQADGTLTKVWETMKATVTVAVGAVGKAFQFLQKHFGAIKSVIGTVAGVLAALKIGSFVLGLVQAAQLIVPFVSTVAAVVAALNPLTVAIMAIGGAVGLMLSNADVRSALTAIGEGIVNTVVTVAKTVWGALTAMGNGIMSVVNGVISFVGNMIKAGAIIIGSVVKTVGNAVSAIGNWFKKIPERANDMKNGAINAFNNLKNGVSNFVTAIKNKFQPLFDIINRVRDGFASVWNYISQPLNVVTGTATSAANTPGHALGTSYFSGGFTRVNERGGEIMNLPNGTQIIPHDISRRMAGAPQISVSVNIAGNVIGNREYANEMADVVCGKILRAFENYA